MCWILPYFSFIFLLFDFFFSFSYHIITFFIFLSSFYSHFLNIIPLFRLSFSLLLLFSSLSPSLLYNLFFLPLLLTNTLMTLSFTSGSKREITVMIEAVKNSNCLTSLLLSLPSSFPHLLPFPLPFLIHSALSPFLPFHSVYFYNDGYSVYEPTTSFALLPSFSLCTNTAHYQVWRSSRITYSGEARWEEDSRVFI